MRLTRAEWVRLLLLWLGGIDLRLTMLAVPPLVPLIHRELHLDEKAVGALVSGPVLLLAVAAAPGSMQSANLGVRGAVIVAQGCGARSSANPTTGTYAPAHSPAPALAPHSAGRPQPGTP